MNHQDACETRKTGASTIGSKFLLLSRGTFPAKANISISFTPFA